MAIYRVGGGGGEGKETKKEKDLRVINGRRKRNKGGKKEKTVE